MSGTRTAVDEMPSREEEDQTADVPVVLEGWRLARWRALHRRVQAAQRGAEAALARLRAAEYQGSDAPEFRAWEQAGWTRDSAEAALSAGVMLWMEGAGLADRTGVDELERPPASAEVEQLGVDDRALRSELCEVAEPSEEAMAAQDAAQAAASSGAAMAAELGGIEPAGGVEPA